MARYVGGGLVGGKAESHGRFDAAIAKPKTFYRLLPDREYSYHHSQQHPGHKGVPELKLMVVGAVGTGKSALIRRFVRGSFLRSKRRRKQNEVTPVESAGTQRHRSKTGQRAFHINLTSGAAPSPNASEKRNTDMNPHPLPEEREGDGLEQENVLGIEMTQKMMRIKYSLTVGVRMAYVSEKVKSRTWSKVG